MEINNTNIQGWGRRQKTFTFLNALVMVLIALAILVGVNYISQRRYFRLDCTFKQEYSLSSKSKEILKQLKEPIIIYAFFTPAQDLFIAEVQRMMTDLLEEYKIHSHGKIQIEIIQPSIDREMVEVLQKKFKLETIAQNDMIIRSGDSQKNVNLIETYERDYGPYGRPSGIKSFKGEEALSAAIKQVIQPQKTIIYFTTGHGEGDEDNSSLDGYTTFIHYLQRENIEKKKINLLEVSQIPADCSALVLLGPKTQISAPETALLNNYLKEGGRLLIMLDPLSETNLSDFMKEWGIKLDGGIVVDPEKCIAIFGEICLITDNYSSHKITDKMIGEVSYFLGAQAVESISPTIATEIVKSSRTSWLETDIETLSKSRAKYHPDSDRKGPIGLAVAVSKTESRLVVIGDSDMIRNKFIEPESLLGFSRVDLPLNALRWLAGQEVFIAIEPKTFEIKRIDLTPERQTFLAWFSLVIIPLIGAILGILMWLIRRK
jgi:ABC-type uncharacterized transport system involved in gliding motility auxiliary subunit